MAKKKEFETQVALFGQNGLAFTTDDTEDTGSLASHIAVLTRATHALTRIIGAVENENEIKREEVPTRVREARIGIEFLNGMCASLANDLARLSGVHHG